MRLDRKYIKTIQDRFAKKGRQAPELSDLERFNQLVFDYRLRGIYWKEHRNDDSSECEAESPVNYDHTIGWTFTYLSNNVVVFDSDNAQRIPMKVYNALSKNAGVIVETPRGIHFYFKNNLNLKPKLSMFTYMERAYSSTYPEDSETEKHVRSMDILTSNRCTVFIPPTHGYKFTRLEELTDTPPQVLDEVIPF